VCDEVWYLTALVRLFHFFFQAEDGIRAFHVTGVQTCALPISAVGRRGGRRRGRDAHLHELLAPPSEIDELRIEALQARAQLILRSEERRVGKECRARWVP